MSNIELYNATLREFETDQAVWVDFLLNKLFCLQRLQEEGKYDLSSLIDTVWEAIYDEVEGGLGVK